MQTQCPLLGRETSVRPTQFKRGNWSIVQCEETGFVFLADPPDYSQLEEEFAWEKTSQEEGRRREQDEPLKHLHRFMTPDGSIVLKVAG